MGKQAGKDRQAGRQAGTTTAAIAAHLGVPEHRHLASLLLLASQEQDHAVRVALVAKGRRRRGWRNMKRACDGDSGRLYPLKPGSIVLLKAASSKAYHFWTLTLDADYC